MQKSLTFKILVMAILTIQVEDNSVIAGIEESMDDIRHGRVTEYDSADLKIYAKFFGVYIGLSYLFSIND